MVKKVITSGDVAKRAEVSQSAVSRAFTPGASVAPETRERILKAANDLGYRPNALARAMISGRSKIIALLVTQMNNPFYPAVVERLSKSLHSRGYNILLFMSEPGQEDQMVQQMMQFQVEGIVLASSALSANVAKECNKTGIPVVLLNRFEETSPSSSVVADNKKGGALAAEFLMSGGHKRIAYIGDPDDNYANRDREAGFVNSIVKHGGSVWGKAFGGCQFEKNAQATRALFSGKEKPDAVFVANDHMAISVMDVLRGELKLRVPEDVSIIGFDNIEAAGWYSYQLTTIAHDLTKTIETTVEILLDQIENQSPSKCNVVMPVKLIVRGSAKLPE